ncbi:MAG: protein kinase [Sandaracinaceae bacterium]
MSRSDPLRDTMSDAAGGTDPEVEPRARRPKRTWDSFEPTVADQNGGSPSPWSEEMTLDGPTRVEMPRALVDPDAPRMAEDADFGDRYRSDEILGQGGMGTIRLHYDRQIGRRVALKSMNDKDAGSSDRSRFIREARIQGQLEHPSIVPVYDVAIDPDGQPFFTMRRVRGMTLEVILERLAMGAPKVFRAQHSRRRLLGAFSRVCQAVHYAHEHGVLHRDIKPANIILGEFGEVYLLDWGLAGLAKQRDEAVRELKALRLTRETMPGSLLGTPGYMSPEQATGGVQELGPPADVYALGCILFEILTLMPLHDGEGVVSLLDATIRGTTDRRPSRRATHQKIDPELDRIVMRATALSSEDRFQSARELFLEIETYLDGRRDEEQRMQLADERARAAATEAKAALSKGDSFEERRQALRDAVGALSLDPSNELALRTFADVTTTPPDALPPDVDESLADASAARLRWVGGAVSIVYASAFVYLPFIAASVVEHWLPVVVSYGFLLTAAVVGLLTARAARPRPRWIAAAMVLSNIGFAATAPFFGPLLVTPSLLAINTAPYALYLGTRGRRLALAFGLGTISTVIGLGMMGAIPVEYAFQDGVLVVHSGALRFAPIPTLVLLTLLALGQMLGAMLGASRIRADLDRAERALHMQSWLLRGLAIDRKSSSVPPPRQ